MKIPFLAAFMESLDRLDGASGVLKRVVVFITLPFVALLSGLYAGSSEAVRILAQGPFKFFFGILIFPFLFTFRISTDARSDLLWCLPAIIAGISIAGLAILTFAQGDRIQQRYRMNAVSAIRQGEFERGKFFSQRVLTAKGEANDSDQFRLAICMLQTQQSELGQQIINDLAPDDHPGFPPAHRLKALNLATLTDRTDSARHAESLRFHLSHAEDNNSEEIQTAYAVYYLATDQVLRAINYLKIAAQKNPSHYHTIASIHGER
ncbi:MAG: hypothetical protein GY818_07495, partial [Planctomycetaceae bacterium]|nr:hypothetical protein [Planctomycetaceae bacterium]